MPESDLYLARNTLVNAVQWHKNGDHPEDECETFVGEDEVPFKGEGHIVRYFRHPAIKGTRECARCGGTMHFHGWIDSGDRGRIVCPGDFIVKTDDGHYIPYRPEVFEKLYGKVTQDA